MDKLLLKNDLEKNLIEEGYETRRFSIFENDRHDCYHLADTTSDDYAVFYLDERGYRREEVNFYVLEDALKYLKILMDRSKESSFVVPINSLSIEEKFILNKKKIELLVENKIKYKEDKSVLNSLREIVAELELNKFPRQEKDLLKFIGDNFQNIDKDLRDEILILQNSYV